MLVATVRGRSGTMWRCRHSACRETGPKRRRCNDTATKGRTVEARSVVAGWGGEQKLTATDSTFSEGVLLSPVLTPVSDDDTGGHSPDALRRALVAVDATAATVGWIGGLWLSGGLEVGAGAPLLASSVFVLLAATTIA